MTSEQYFNRVVKEWNYIGAFYLFETRVIPYYENILIDPLFQHMIGIMCHDLYDAGVSPRMAALRILGSQLSAAQHVWKEYLKTNAQ